MISKMTNARDGALPAITNTQLDNNRLSMFSSSVSFGGKKVADDNNKNSKIGNNNVSDNDSESDFDCLF